ncbi:amidohydrolase family protein, partial [Gilvimarinus sp. 1_MG-2023]
VHTQCQQHDLLTLGLGPHAPYTVSDAPLRQVRAMADELQLPVQIHLHETAFEVQDSLEKYGKRPIERLFDLGFLAPGVSCV